jgi:predicted DNA-binding transcriptional regulator AlpA
MICPHCTTELLDYAGVSARLSMNVATLRQYVYRGTFPDPDGHFGGRPVWCASTVDAWVRPGRGRRRGVKGADRRPVA